MSQSVAAVQPGANILQPWSADQLSQDAQASAALLAIAKRPFTQQIYSTTFNPVYGSPTVVSVPIVAVGLITKFWVRVSTVVTNPGGGNTLTRGSYGPFSSFSLIQYTDPNTNQRINTTGFHLAAITARRHRRIPGSALSTDSPSGFGSVIQPIACPATIAAGASGTVAAMYEVPLGVARGSLKGCVFAGAVFATQSLQLTFNPNFATNGSDPLAAVFTGSGTGANAPTYATTVTVWQEYYDQFPLGLLNLMSPSLSTVYEIKYTTTSPIIANSDNYVRFSNLRQFLSALLIYDNGGTLNAGTDIVNFKLQSANQTTEFQRDPFLQSYLTRNHYGDDYPAGSYMFDFQASPIITAAEGNTVLTMNPSSVNSNAFLGTGWESLATSQVLATAPSLSGVSGAA